MKQIIFSHADSPLAPNPFIPPPHGAQRQNQFFGKTGRGALLDADSRENGFHANLLMCLFVFVALCVCLCVLVSYATEVRLSRMWRTVTINIPIPATVRRNFFFLFFNLFGRFA